MKLNNRLSRESKKFYERELRQYWKNKKKLDKILSNNKKRSKIAPTSSRVIEYLQERMEYIENVIEQLNAFEKEVFFLIFKDNCTWLYCETEKNIGKNTYYNILNKAIYLLAKEFGEI